MRRKLDLKFEIVIIGCVCASLKLFSDKIKAVGSPMPPHQPCVLPDGSHFKPWCLPPGDVFVKLSAGAEEDGQSRYQCQQKGYGGSNGHDEV